MAMAYFFRAGEYIEMRSDYAKALADYDAAIKLSPPTSPLLYRYYWVRGYVQALFGQDQKRAIADYTQALRLKPMMPLAYATRAAAQQKLGKLHEALDDYSTAINIAPDYGFAYLQRAAIYAELGDAASAEADRVKARTLPQGWYVQPAVLP